MEVSLNASISSDGNLVFTLNGNLPEKSYRGEGRHVVDLICQECVIEDNPDFFVDGYDLSNGRGFLAALFIFHPTWNALGSYKEMIHMGFPPSEKVTTVRTNLFAPVEMLELLKNDWMLPNLEFVFTSEKSANVSKPAPFKPSLAFGGGLDSGAAISLLKNAVDSYYIANSSPCNVRIGIAKILEKFQGHILNTNVRSLYSVSGFPHWMIPYMPSLLRGDKYCLTGSILESQYLRDGHGYHNSSGNLWIKMLQLAGVEALPLSCHSEFTNAYIVAKSGNMELIAGNCTDEWGFGYKALRKAILLRPFQDKYEETILDLEAHGFIIAPKLKFAQQSKMLTSISTSALLTNQSSSTSISNLKKFGAHAKLPWAFKYHPDNFSNHNWPEVILKTIQESQKDFGITSMSEEDLVLLQSYEHEKFLIENYPIEFVESLT